MRLKSECTGLNFKNMEKTPENFSLLMYGTPDNEMLGEILARNQQVIDSGNDTTGYFQKEIDYYLKLKENIFYQSGTLPRGIEKIILQLIESYSFWQSVQSIKSRSILNRDSYIHNLIDVSITYMVSCEIAKLFNSDEKDFSLSNIWSHHAAQVASDGITSAEEILYITTQFDLKSDDRKESIKRFLQFRNKTIAHNNGIIETTWNDFLDTIHFVVRSWGLVDQIYSPQCFPRPVQMSDELYRPLQSDFSAVEIVQMKEHRALILNDIFKAASTNLCSGEVDHVKPFGEFKVSVKITTIPLSSTTSTHAK